MRGGASNRQQRIRDIVDEIARLSDELHSLVLDPDTPLVPPPAPPAPPSPPPEFADPAVPPRSHNPNSTAFFQTDDRVIVTSNRNGLRGSLGTVTNVNDRFVFFRLDSTNTVIWRAPRNIRRVHPPP